MLGGAVADAAHAAHAAAAAAAAKGSHIRALLWRAMQSACATTTEAQRSAMRVLLLATALFTHAVHAITTRTITTRPPPSTPHLRTTRSAPTLLPTCRWPCRWRECERVQPYFF